jgi:hypothetical protein
LENGRERTGRCDETHGILRAAHDSGVLENERRVDEFDRLHVDDLLRQVKAVKVKAASGGLAAAHGIKIGRIQINAENAGCNGEVNAVETVPSGDSQDDHGCRPAERLGVREQVG